MSHAVSLISDDSYLVYNALEGMKKKKKKILFTAVALHCFKPLDLRGSAIERTGSVSRITQVVLLPGDQRAKLHLEWDVLLIQWLAQPETALMGAVISPVLLLLAMIGSSRS